MRTGRLWIGAGLGMALLLSFNVNGARAQAPEGLPPPAGAAGGGASGPMAGAPPVVRHETLAHPGLEEHHEEGHEGHVEEEHHDEGGGLYILADYLYLRARRRALDYAITDPVVNGSVQGTVSSLIWQNNSGYRLAGGYALNHGWEIGASYFYFHTTDNRLAAAPTGGALFATLTAPGIDQVSTAAATSSLNMDVIDVEAAKRIDCHDGLSLRLSGGLRIAEIQQKLNAAYTGGTAGTGVTAVQSPINFTGIGVRVGGEGWWNPGECWGGMLHGLGLYAKGYGSLLSGEFHSRLTQVVNSGATPVVDVSDKFDKVVPVLEMGIGLGWQNEHVQVRVGYELMNYFGLVDSVDFVDSNSFGKISHRVSDLSLEGLVVSVGLFF